MREAPRYDVQAPENPSHHQPEHDQGLDSGQRPNTGCNDGTHRMCKAAPPGRVAPGERVLDRILGAVHLTHQGAAHHWPQGLSN